MTEQNGRSKNASSTTAGNVGGGGEFVEGWTMAQTLGEGAYGE